MSEFFGKKLLPLDGSEVSSDYKAIKQWSFSGESRSDASEQTAALVLRKALLLMSSKDFADDPARSTLVGLWYLMFLTKQR